MSPALLKAALGADDRARTGDLDLGKVALYQLSYVRVSSMIAEFNASLNSPFSASIHTPPRMWSWRCQGRSIGLAGTLRLKRVRSSPARTTEATLTTRRRG